MLSGEYNCISSSIYNYLTHNLNIPIRFESLCFDYSFFALSQFDGYMSISSPLLIARRNLEKWGGYVVFPEFTNVEEALGFADDLYASKGKGLPVSINLKYDVLDPLGFDNDFWHFHWIAGREGKQYRMFNQYEKGYYTVDEERLILAINNRFNYRDYPKFTPFLSVYVEDAETMKSLLPGPIEELRALESAVRDYPVLHNKAIGASFLASLRRYLQERVGKEKLYFIMNYLYVIVRSRRFATQYLAREGLSSLEPLRQIQDGWSQFRDVVGMTLVRRSESEFARMEQLFEELIDREVQAMEIALEELTLRVQ